MPVRPQIAATLCIDSVNRNQPAAGQGDPIEAVFSEIGQILDLPLNRVRTIRAFALQADLLWTKAKGQLFTYHKAGQGACHNISPEGGNGKAGERPIYGGDGRVELCDGAEEVRNKTRGGLFIDLGRRTDLLHLPAVHHGDAVGKRHGFFLIMGDHDEGNPGSFLNGHQFELGVFAQLLVQRGERFVEEEQFWLARQGAGKGNPLSLTARNLVRFPLGEGGKLYQVQHGANTVGALGCGHGFVLQAVTYVLFHGHVREEGIALEHHVNWAFPWWNARHVLAIKENSARGWFFKPGEHPQKGGLAAARSAKKGENLALCDG